MLINSKKILYPSTVPFQFLLKRISRDDDKIGKEKTKETSANKVI